MMAKILTAALLLATALVITPAAPVAPSSAVSAQEQEQQQITSTPRDIRVIDSAGILEQIIGEIQNMRLIDYDLYQNGTANYTLQQTAGVNKTLEVKTTHPYTPDNGYIYNSSGIFTPNGQQQIIIETFPPRMGPGS